MPMKSTIALLMTCLLPTAAFAAVATQDVRYTVGNVEHIGFLAYDNASDAKRPGILIAPEWIGVNDYSRGRAKQLAEMGYVAFVHDPYGGGKNAADPKQAAEWSGVLKANRPELRKRVNAGLAELRKQKRVDGSKIAAIGYCFGGTSVLELARSGADVAGVVSFHGNLSTTMPAKAGDVKAKVLVCHGAIDSIVPPEEVAAFQKEMQDAKVDWQLVSYGNAVHSFTNPGAKGTAPGVKYDEKADKRSWEAMKAFFQELFSGRGAIGQGADAGFHQPPIPGAIAGPPANVNPPGEVFVGVKDAKRVVFVCDATGGMINKFGPVKFELQKAIAALDEQALYSVVFFSDGAKYHIIDRKQLLPATLKNKRATYYFFEQISPNGMTDPLPALEAAFSLRPDLVYFLTDGEFNNLRTPAQVRDAVKRLNKNNARVNTIMFQAFDKDGEQALQQIAADSGGTYVRSKSRNSCWLARPQ